MISTDLTRCVPVPTIHSVSKILIAVFLSLFLLPALAQDGDGEARTVDQLRLAIGTEQKRIEQLEQRLDGAEGLLLEAVNSRRMRARMSLLEINLEYLGHVAATTKAERPKDTDAVFDAQLDLLKSTTQILVSAIQLPEEKLPPAELAATYSRLFAKIDQINRIYEISIETLDFGAQLGKDVAPMRETLKQNMRDRAENGSVLLELAMSEVNALRASSAAVPEDTDTKARLSVITAHVTNLANQMTRVLDIMKTLEMDTTQYQNQLLLATGQITTDLFQINVFTNLFLGWGETLWNGIIENGPGLLFNLILLVIIVFAFYKLASVAQRVTEAGLEKSQFELSLLLKRMVISIVRNGILIIGILIGLSQIGVSLGPLFAGMGLIGLVVGFALQDTLSNFAAGMLILIYRPFDVDDVIEAGGVSGMVSKMSLVNTTFMTFDNQTIIVPNGKIWGDVIKNVTAQTVRRIDLVFGISYGEDLDKAERVMAEVVAAHPAVLKDPETMICLHELADSSVNYVVRPWVNRDDYWPTYWDLMRAMKVAFDKEGIEIPFPQRDVHLKQEAQD